MAAPVDCSSYDNNCGDCVLSNGPCYFCAGVGCVSNVTASCGANAITTKFGNCPLPTHQFQPGGIYIFAFILFGLAIISMIVQVILRHPKYVLSTQKAQRIIPVVTRFFVCLFAVVFTGIATNKLLTEQKTMTGQAPIPGMMGIGVGFFLCGVTPQNENAFKASTTTTFHGANNVIIGFAMFVYAVICFLGWFVDSLMILRGSRMASFTTFLFAVLIIAIQPALGLQGAMPLNADPPCFLGSSIGTAELFATVQIIPLIMCVFLPVVLLSFEPVAPEKLKKWMPTFLKAAVPKPAIAALEEEGSQGASMIKLPRHYSWQNFIIGGYFLVFVVSVTWGLVLCVLTFFSKLFDGSIWDQIKSEFSTTLFPLFDVIFYLTGKLIHHLLWVNVYKEGKFGVDAGLVAEQEVLMQSDDEQNLLGGAEERFKKMGQGLLDKAKGNNNNKEGLAAQGPSGYGATEETNNLSPANNDDDNNNNRAVRPKSSAAFTKLQQQEQQQQAAGKNISSKSKKSATTSGSTPSSIAIFDSENQDDMSIGQNQSQGDLPEEAHSGSVLRHSSLRESASKGEAVEAFPEATSERRPVSSRFFIAEMEEQQWEEKAKVENQRVIESADSIYRPPAYFMAIACLLFLLIASLFDVWAATGDPSFVSDIATMPNPEFFASQCITLAETYHSFVDGTHHAKSKCWQLAAIGPLVICMWVFLSIWLFVSIYTYVVNNRTGDMVQLVTLGINFFFALLLSGFSGIAPSASCMLKDFEGIDCSLDFVEHPGWARGPSGPVAGLLCGCVGFSFFFFLGQLYVPLRLPRPVLPPNNMIAKYGFWTQFVEPQANRKHRIFFVTKPLFLVIQYHALVSAIGRLIKTISQNWLTLLAFWTPIAAYDYHSMVINQLVLDGRQLELHVTFADFCFVWFRESFLNLVSGSLWSRYSKFSVEKYYDSCIRFKEPPHCAGLFRYFDVPVTQTLGQTFYAFGHIVAQRPANISEFSLRLTELQSEMIWFGDMQVRLPTNALQKLKTNHPIATMDPQGAHLDSQLQIFTQELCGVCGIGEFECKCSCDLHTPLCRECFAEHQRKAVDTFRREMKNANTSWLWRKINEKLDPRDLHKIAPIIPLPEECETSDERAALQRAWLGLKRSMTEAAAKTLPESALQRFGIDKKALDQEKLDRARKAQEEEEEAERNRIYQLNELTGDDKFRAQKRIALFYESNNVKGDAEKAMSSELSEEEFIARLCKKHKVAVEEEREAAEAESLLPEDKKKKKADDEEQEEKTKKSKKEIEESKSGKNKKESKNANDDDENEGGEKVKSASNHVGNNDNSPTSKKTSKKNLAQDSSDSTAKFTSESKNRPSASSANLHDNKEDNDDADSMGVPSGILKKSTRTSVAVEKPGKKSTVSFSERNCEEEVTNSDKEDDEKSHRVAVSMNVAAAAPSEGKKVEQQAPAGVSIEILEDKPVSTNQVENNNNNNNQNVHENHSPVQENNNTKDNDNDDDHHQEHSNPVLSSSTPGVKSTSTLAALEYFSQHDEGGAKTGEES